MKLDSTKFDADADLGKLASRGFTAFLSRIGSPIPLHLAQVDLASLAGIVCLSTCLFVAAVWFIFMSFAVATARAKGAVSVPAYADFVQLLRHSALWLILYQVVHLGLANRLSKVMNMDSQNYSWSNRFVFICSLSVGVMFAIAVALGGTYVLVDTLHPWTWSHRHGDVLIGVTLAAPIGVALLVAVPWARQRALISLEAVGTLRARGVSQFAGIAVILFVGAATLFAMFVAIRYLSAEKEERNQRDFAERSDLRAPIPGTVQRCVTEAGKLFCLVSMMPNAHQQFVLYGPWKLGFGPDLLRMTYAPADWDPTPAVGHQVRGVPLQRGAIVDVELSTRLREACHTFAAEHPADFVYAFQLIGRPSTQMHSRELNIALENSEVLRDVLEKNCVAGTPMRARQKP